MVSFRLCEVSSTRALAWISYAREALRTATNDPDGVELAEDAVTMINGFLDDWESQARRAPTLSPSLELSEPELEFVGHAFLQMSQYLAARADERGFDVSPPEADEFYRALAEAVIATLEFSDDAASSEFGTVLRTSWPRTERLAANDSPLHD